MGSLDELMSEIDGSVTGRSGSARGRTLHRMTELFVGSQGSLAPDGIDLFGAVIGRLAAASDLRARAALAERLACLPSAPAGVIEALAADEILVARPVLVGSTCLDDQALIAVAAEQGGDHMLAISERPELSAAVTDILVAKGDRIVRHAVVSNEGARFSAAGMAGLLEHASVDPGLGMLLSGRSDLPPGTRQRLADVAARAKLPGSRQVAGGPLAGVAATIAHPNPSDADAELTAADRSADEAELRDLAVAGDTGRVVSALATLTGLSSPSVARLFAERDNDLPIVIGRAHGWSWWTVRALLRLRDPGLTERHQFRRAEETFDGLATATASRVVHFLRVRDAAAAVAAGGRLTPA